MGKMNNDKKTKTIRKEKKKEKYEGENTKANNKKIKKFNKNLAFLPQNNLVQIEISFFFLSFT